MTQTLFIGAWLSAVSVGIMLMIGWVLNIISLVNSEVLNGMVLLRAAGIFIAPLGGVLGWL